MGRGSGKIEGGEDAKSTEDSGRRVWLMVSKAAEVLSIEAESTVWMNGLDNLEVWWRWEPDWSHGPNEQRIHKHEKMGIEATVLPRIRNMMKLFWALTPVSWHQGVHLLQKPGLHSS